MSNSSINIVRPKVILICGYRRTGKDTFYQKLIGEKFPFSWLVYAATTDKRATERWQTLIAKASQIKRLAFADKLKAEIKEIYGIDPAIPDKQKDTKMFIHHITGEKVSYRDICIEWGTFRKWRNHNYWVSKVWEEMHNNNIYLITDFRFAEELIYLYGKPGVEIITIRLYRKSVPEPPLEIESEHGLDLIRTDYLLLEEPLDEEISEKFPQYRNFQEIATI